MDAEPVPDNFKNKVLKGFAWEASTKILVQLLSWASTIIVARILTPEDYGLVLIAGIYTGFLTMISGLGISSGIVHRDKVSSAELSTLFWLSFAIGGVIYALLYVLAPYISSLYGNQIVSGILRVAGLMIILASINIVPHAVMMRELNFKFAALIDLISKLILIGTTLTLAYLDYGYWSLVTSTVIAQAFSFIAYMFALKERPTFTLNVRVINDIVYFGLKVLTSRLLMWWNNSSPATIITTFLDKQQAGFMQMANTLATIPLTKVGEIFDKIAFPSIAAIKGDKTRAKSVFLEMHRYLLLITCPMFAGIASISQQIVDLLLGEKWSAIAIPLQLLCATNIIRVSAQLIPRVLEGMGQPIASAKYQLITGILCPLGMFLGTYYGLNGVILGWLVTLPLTYIYLYLTAAPLLNISAKEFLATVIPPLASGLSIILACIVVNDLFSEYGPLNILLLKIITGISVFLFTGFFLFRTQLGEIKKLMGSR